MEQELQQKINKAIEESLPQNMGKVLQERLAAGDAAEKDLAHCKKNLAREERDCASLRKSLSQHGDIKVREDALKEKEEAVAERERNATIDQLRYQLMCEQANSEYARNVALGLVRNTEYRKGLDRSTVEYDYLTDPQTGLGNNVAVPGTETEVKTAT